MKSPAVVSRARARVSNPTDRQLDICVAVVWVSAFVGVVLMVMLLSLPSQL